MSCTMALRSLRVDSRFFIFWTAGESALTLYRHGHDNAVQKQGAP